MRAGVNDRGVDGEVNPIGPYVAFVDDESMHCRLAQAVLANAGYRPLLGADGTDAIALRFGDPEPAAMFLNGLMPMPGPDAIAEIRRREAAEGLPRMPIALESGWAPGGVGRALRRRYVRIPWNRDELIEALEGLLALRRDKPDESAK